MSAREHFEEHGWLVVRGAIAPARVAELERALDAVIPEDSYPAWGDRVVEVAGISRAAPAIADLAIDAALGELAGRALGAARIQLLQDTVFIKPAARPATVAWHQDFTYLGYLDRPGVVTLRLALTPCTIASGCLRVLDGSHRWPHPALNLALRRGEVEDTLALLPPDLRARADGGGTVLELEPGDISLHHCLTFHGSEPNTSGRPRKTLAFRLLDGACRLVPENLPAPEARAYFPADDRGHLDTTAFPVLWADNVAA
ncbi:MAG TPA: phytanoyl-CoA dioxygenase family protein [Kofleriaceae bacterium]|nr:phytanoyl-CoA dioxygenase family protein [Kofleriaceae bacterium]